MFKYNLMCTCLPHKEVHNAEDAEDVHEDGGGHVARVLLQIQIRQQSSNHAPNLVKGCVNDTS